jgi:hypothetical protein
VEDTTVHTLEQHHVKDVLLDRILLQAPPANLALEASIPTLILLPPVPIVRMVGVVLLEPLIAFHAKLVIPELQGKLHAHHVLLESSLLLEAYVLTAQLASTRVVQDQLHVLSVQLALPV